MNHIVQPYKESDAEFLSGLHRLSLELTTGCNLKCTHCYADSDSSKFRQDKLKPKDYERLMDEGRVLGCRAIQFIGGEPTMNKHLPYFLKYAHTISYYSIEVFTNATYLPDYLLSALKESNASIAFSFYSANEMIHDAITQIRGSFQRTVNNIRGAVNAGVPLRGNIIVMSQNQKTLDDTVDYLHKLGVRSVGIDHVRGVGRGKNKIGRSGIDELCHNCWRGNLAISSEGIGYPCIMGREFPVGSVYQKSLKDILSGSSLQEFRSLSHAKHKYKTDRCNPDEGDSCNPDHSNDCSPDKSNDCGPDQCRPDVGLPPSVCCKPDGW
jgi:sulfatase maturation enzyme AslB (radical SAM superfamily)